MLRTICKSKIHGATITETKLEYEGSITIPVDLAREANILVYERVQIVNLNNGSRIETYVIPGKEGSGEICLNGPAAREAMVGDKVHIISYGMMDEEEARKLKIKMVRLQAGNKIKDVKEVSIDD